MTGPQDPFATPDPNNPPPSGGVPPEYPAYGQQPPPGYGQPQYGQPQYGQQPFGQPPYPQSSGTSPLAIGALISAFLCSPLGIVLGFVAKSQIRKTGQSGNGLATAAIIIGVLSMLLGVLLFASGASNLETSP